MEAVDSGLVSSSSIEDTWSQFGATFKKSITQAAFGIVRTLEKTTPSR
jgi:hypothetical protein